ncbi:MAG: LamG domain-containing protein [bacterium]|nr:LamG domain-containing protein [bacterium]
MRRTMISISCVALLLSLATNLSGEAATPARTSQEETTSSLDRDSHLVGWWNFDESSGRVAHGSSQHPHNGDLKGELTFDKSSVPGRIGSALKFPGDASVEVTAYRGVSGTHSRTIAVWIRTKSPRGEVVSWGLDDYGKMWTLGFIRERIGVTPKGGYLYINPEIHDGQWHHVVAVVEDAELPNLHDDVKLYLDGEPAEIHDIGLLDLWPIETGSDLDVRIGKGFQGAMDDLRIYDRDLSDKEIKDLFGSVSTRSSSESR